MAKFCLIFSILFCSIITTAQSYITTQDINVRKGAGTKYETLGVLPKGSKIEVLEKNGKWSKINYENDKGYISTKFLQPTSTENVSNSKGSSNIRMWIVIGVIIVVLFIFRKNPALNILFKMLGGLFKLVMPETSSNFASGTNRVSKVSQYRCSLCGKRQSTDGSPDRSSVMMCGSGKSHDWRKVSY